MNVHIIYGNTTASLNQIEHVCNVTLIRNMIKATAYRVHYAHMYMAGVCRLQEVATIET